MTLPQPAPSHSESTRDRILEVTAELYRRQGVHATGLKQIATAAGAPTGSIYHHFRGGKWSLTRDVIETAGRGYRDSVQSILGQTTNVPDGIVQSFDVAGQLLRQSDYADACPIATIALEVASSDEGLRRATASVFEDWLAMLQRWFAGAGVCADDSRELAVAYLAALEGAFVLSRALRSTEPLHAAARHLRAATLAAMQDTPGGHATVDG